MSDYYQFRDETGTPIDYYQLVNDNNELCKELENSQQEIQQLKRQIRIKNKWCQLIRDIGFDYDGYNDLENLKKIIDELVEYAGRAIDSDDKTVAYVGGDGKKKNILFEEIKEENNE